jgi:gamma-glutamylcyclotransferase (GGCT)/AIG2-like uncharacterized protein YtfP
MLALFAYGTLCDPDYVRALFGRSFSMQPASVDGYVVVRADGGYLGAIPRAGGTVRGVVVALDARAYAVADEWEDLTVYERRTVEARLEGSSGVQRCFIYVRPDAAGPMRTDERLADRSRDEVLADIRTFVASRRMPPLPDT